MKLGGATSGNSAEAPVEVELHTPKCPEFDRKELNTVAVQVLEEEFEDFGKKSGTGGADEMPKKGSKGKKGKGKKK